MKSKFIPKTAQIKDKKRQIGIKFEKEPPEMIKQIIFGEEMWMTKRQYQQFRKLEEDIEKSISKRVDDALLKGLSPQQVEDTVTMQLMDEAKIRVAI
jgi:hypothetical protein